MLQTIGSWFTHQTAMGPVWAILVTLVGVPLVNEVVQRTRGTRAESILQGFCLGLLKIPYVGAFIVKWPVVGELLYAFAPQQKADLPKPLLTIAMEKKSVTAGEIVANKSTLPILIIAACSFSYCATIPPGPNGQPTTDQYRAAFTQCLKTENVDALTGSEGQQILQILESGGFTAQQIEQKIEAVAISAGGAEAGIVASCAVLAWFELNPIASEKKPTPSQTAARLYQARHMKTLKHNGPTATAGQ